MHQHRPRERGGLAAVEPRQRQLEHRLRAAQHVERAAQLGDMVGGFATHEARQGGGIGRMDARQDLAELGCDFAARRLVGRVAQQLAGDGDAADAAHHIGLAQGVLGRQLEQGFGRAHAGRMGGLQHAELGGTVDGDGTLAIGLALGRRIAAQDQRVAFAVDQRVETPGLARGAAGLATQTFDCGGGAEMAAGRFGEHAGDVFGFGRHVNGHLPGLWHRLRRVVRGPRQLGRSITCRAPSRP